MAPNDQQVVVGVFEDQAMAERAVDALENAGFNSDQIGFVRRDQSQGTDGQDTTAERSNDTAGGAVTGAVSGGILGGILGAAAALLIPGIGPVVAGGILATTLTGAAVGAAAGGILGGLTKLGVPEEDARYYQGEFEQGRTIVTVRADGRQQEAIQILRRHGAYDASTRDAGMTSGAGTGYGVSQGNMADERQMEAANMTPNNQQSGQGQWAGGNWEDVSPQYRNFWQQHYGNQGGRWEDYSPVYQYGWEMRNNPQYRNLSWSQAEPQLRRDWETRYPDRSWDETSPMLRETWDTGDMGAYDTEGGQRLPIREEQLQAQKQPVQTGEVQIGKQVTEREQSINVPVTREEVYVERHDFAPQPTDQPITEGDDQTIRVPVVEEQVQVMKQPVQTGEVVIGKRQVQENQQVSDTVRREEPRIDREGDVNVQESGTDQFRNDQPENRP
jgi:uncharacterized protein (TIGR02271 family)